MKGKNKNNNDKKARKPETGEASAYSEVLDSSENKPTDDFMDTPAESSKKSVTLNDLAEIDPELLTGKSTETAAAPKRLSLPASKGGKLKEAAPEMPVIPAEINLDKNEAALEKFHIRRNAGIVFVVLGVLLITIIAAVTFALDTGMDTSFISPLTVHGRDISSGEFSFMYHYELLSEGVDLFAADAEQKLLSPYLDDDSFATYRDYFRYVTAQDFQKMEILYDDATAQGYSIEKAHYDRAGAYINWLKSKADELGVPLDTYIKGVFGTQVDEQIIINTLARKYFTDDYADGEKLIQLSATDDQAEEAYSQSRNSYDLVSYKMIHMTYDQREQAFIDNDDFSHEDIRNWLFDEARKEGDGVLIPDDNGFPIIIVFVSRVRMSEKLRNCYIISANVQAEDMTPDKAATQALSQEIYDYIDDADSCNEVENRFNDYILAGQLSVLHDSQIFKNKLNQALSSWIFADERQFGDKTLIEVDGTFYVLYFISESPNPEWYDMVNSFLRMNNLQQFIQSKAEEYTYSFNSDGLNQIKDVP